MIIGIDPDVDRSGIAVINNEITSKMSDVVLLQYPLWDIFDYLLSANGCSKHDVKVYIEAGWLNKKGLSFGSDEDRMKAIRVGMNHAIGKQIEAFCIEKQIKHFLIRPMYKKWSHEDFTTLTGSKIKRTNKEKRSAASLIFYNTEMGYKK